MNKTMSINYSNRSLNYIHTVHNMIKLCLFLYIIEKNGYLMYGAAHLYSSNVRKIYLCRSLLNKEMITFIW
jgi:hypothetical protein